MGLKPTTSPRQGALSSPCGCRLSIYGRMFTELPKTLKIILPPLAHPQQTQCVPVLRGRKHAQLLTGQSPESL